MNEEGLIRQLLLNARATFLWWFQVPTARQKTMLVGDAVLIGMPNRRGDSTDVPNAVSELTVAGRRWRIEYLTESDARWREGDVGHNDVWGAMVWGMVILERCGRQECPTRSVRGTCRQRPCTCLMWRRPLE